MFARVAKLRHLLWTKSHTQHLVGCAPKFGSAPAACARSASLCRSRGFFVSSSRRLTDHLVRASHAQRSANALHPSVRGVQHGQRTRRLQTLPALHNSRSGARCSAPAAPVTPTSTSCAIERARSPSHPRTRASTRRHRNTRSPPSPPAPQSPTRDFSLSNPSASPTYCSVPRRIVTLHATPFARDPRTSTSSKYSGRAFRRRHHNAPASARPPPAPPSGLPSPAASSSSRPKSSDDPPARPAAPSTRSRCSAPPASACSSPSPARGSTRSRPSRPPRSAPTPRPAASPATPPPSSAEAPILQSAGLSRLCVHEFHV